MKVGLIGINRYAKWLNFACNVHAYAFQEFLRQHEYDVTVLDYKPVYFDNFDMKNPVKDAEQSYRAAVRRKESEATLRRLAEMAMGFRTAQAERLIRYQKFEDFIAKYLRFTEEVYDSDSLEISDPGMDCYICVTDVIWQSQPRHIFDHGFLLASKAFEGKRKIAYAPSRGASKGFTEKEEELFLQYLEDFDAVSVREEDFKSYIESKTSRSVPMVADPVLLHDRAFWEKVSTPPAEEKYVVLYYVMEQARDTIAKAVEYAKLHDLTLVELSDRPLKYGRISDPDLKHVARYDVGIEEWLGYIENAEAVFTNSFHGCCFSMLFEKTFFVGRRNGPKVPNFLATFHLSEQQFGPDDDVAELPHAIDYGKVAEVLERRRAESEAFILGALENAERLVRSGVAHDESKYQARRESITYPIHFHSGYVSDGSLNDSVAIPRVASLLKIGSKALKSGALEYTYRGRRYENKGESQIPRNWFRSKNHKFLGWTLRFRIDNRWVWYLEGDRLAIGTVKGAELDNEKKVFQSGDKIPYLPVNRIASVVFVAKWL